MIEYLLAREGTKLNYQNIMKISFNGLCLYGQVMNQVCFIKKERKGENKKFSIAFERLNVCLIECDTWIMSKAKNGRFSIHPKIIQGETSFVFIVENTIFLSWTKYFLLLSLKNQFSSHWWNIFGFCFWKINVPLPGETFSSFVFENASQVIPFLPWMRRCKGLLMQKRLFD